jgi:hypothetical protein
MVLINFVKKVDSEHMVSVVKRLSVRMNVQVSSQVTLSGILKIRDRQSFRTSGFSSIIISLFQYLYRLAFEIGMTGIGNQHLFTLSNKSFVLRLS